MCDFCDLKNLTPEDLPRGIHVPHGGVARAAFTLTAGRWIDYDHYDYWKGGSFEGWFDEQHRLHREDGAAVDVPCGRGGYYLHGVEVTRNDILEPTSVTPDRIRSDPNSEVRRVLRERYGELRYLTDTGARLIDVDTTPLDATVIGGPCITRALLEDHEGDRYLVASDGSTARVYHMRVPPGTPTCRQAYEALCGRSGARTLVEA